MKKQELVNTIINNVKEADASIIKVYGVSFGVGYDLNIKVTFTNQEVLHLKAHAMRQSWALIGHLRNNQVEFKRYTGSNDLYRDKVIAYWQDTPKKALSEYLNRLSKDDLYSMINDLSEQLSQ